MKTTFGRLFSVTALVLAATIILMGFFFWGIVRGYLRMEQEDELTANAQSVADLAADYAMTYSFYHYTEGYTQDLSLSMNIIIAAQVSNTDTLLCNTEGKVLVCSCQVPVCSHTGQYLDQPYVQDILQKNGDFRAKTLTGLYTQERYCAAKPFFLDDGTAVGIVVVSQAIDGSTKILSQLTEIFMVAAVVALILAVIGISFFTGNQVRPLKALAQAAREFGHGNLKARVRTGGDNTEELDEVAIAFNNMAASLEQSEYQRQEFVANVSHELKTPMTTISGYVDGILDGTIPPEKARHYLDIVSDETKRLSRLVRSMLEVSRLQDQGIPLEKMGNFDVAECLGQVLITFEKKINDKALEVQVDFPQYPVYARGVLDSITQVVYNLVDNAVKFCPEGGQLGLTLRERDTKVYVSVSNTGQTIPGEELPLVFDRFHKLDKSRSLNRDGWGLGLYIVKTIVCSHGEDISVTSRDGKTEFTFTLTQVHSL